MHVFFADSIFQALAAQYICGQLRSILEGELWGQYAALIEEEEEVASQLQGDSQNETGTSALRNGSERVFTSGHARLVGLSPRWTLYLIRLIFVLSDLGCY